VIVNLKRNAAMQNSRPSELSHLTLGQESEGSTPLEADRIPEALSPHDIELNSRL
jgi:hypothetical protein